MSNFTPNLAQKTHIMRNRLKKDVHFVWTQEMDSEFAAIQQAIAEATVLIHFDPNKQVIIETDASLKGLVAVLIQEGKPVRFLSKSLTKTEADYSNIEREMLAILFACERLHLYIFCREVTIHTDHRPLQHIFQKPVSLAPPRLQRLLLWLRRYDVKVKYVGSKSVLLADTLSRLIEPGTDKNIPGLNVQIAQVLKIRQTKLATMQEETMADPCLQILKSLIPSGWPESMQDLPNEVKPYLCVKDELGIIDR